MNDLYRAHGARVGALALVFSSLLSACVTQGGPAPSSSEPTAVDKVMSGREKMEIVARQVQQIPPRVFQTLPQQINRNTFGPMHKGLDFVGFECHMALTPSGERCSIGETLSYAFELGTLSSSIVQSILPQSMLVFDPELDRLNLRSHFKYPGAERKPHVSVIEATPNSIDFLVKMPKATVAEANEAAKAYCATQGKPASFAGVNVGCIRPDAALIAANQKAARITGSKADKPQNLWYSYSVMAFDCGNSSGAKTTATKNRTATNSAGNGKPVNLNGLWVREGTDLMYKIVQKGDEVTAYAQFDFPNLNEKKGFAHWKATLDGNNLSGDYLIRRMGGGPSIQQAKAICGENGWRVQVPIRLTASANSDRLVGEWLNQPARIRDCQTGDRKSWDRVVYVRKGN